MLLLTLYCKTMYCYRWLSPGMFITSDTEMNWDQLWTMVQYEEDSALKQADMLYSSPWWIRWMMNRAHGKPFAIHHKQESRLIKVLGNIFKIQYVGASYYPLKKRTAFLPNKVQCSRTQRYTASKSHRESCIHENWRTVVPKRTRKTTCCSQEQIRDVDYKIYLVKKQDHLGKHKVKCEASGRRDATSWTTESQAYLFQQCKSRMNKNDKQSPSWSRSLNPTSTRNNFSKIWARLRRSTGSVKHRKGCWKTWIKQWSSTSAKTLKSFRALTANPLQKLWSFIADTDEIWSTVEAVNQARL